MHLRGTPPTMAFALLALTWSIGESAAPSVQAASGPTVCTFAFDLVASPGLSTSPSSGTLTTNGQTGTISCNGPVNGRQPTGPGRTGIQGRYGTKGGDTCQSGGGGDGVNAITIPTSAGNQDITNTFTYTYGPLQSGGLFAGQFQGDRLSGTFESRPNGVATCATTPMTRFHVTGKGTLRS